MIEILCEMFDMSEAQKNFLKWFGGISSALVLSFIIGGVYLYRAQGQTTTQIENLLEVSRSLKEYHDRDIVLIRENIGEIKDTQKEIRLDIKELIKQ